MAVERPPRGEKFKVVDNEWRGEDGRGVTRYEALHGDDYVEEDDEGNLLCSRYKGRWLTKSELAAENRKRAVGRWLDSRAVQ